MKRIIILCFLIITSFLFFFMFNKDTESKTASEATKSTSETDVKTEKTENKIQGVWLTYSEIGGLVKGKTEDEYKENIETVMKNLKANKINTVFYQCRAFCDSLYDSDIFPASKYITASSSAPDFDPFEIFSEKAEDYEISVHCWINPYRISYDNTFGNLPKGSPARELYKNDKSTLIICDSGIFLNPAHSESRRLVLSGIREIISKYKVSGIHFDDYFYPEEEKLNDDKMYKEYKEQGGMLSLADWRRENVNVLVSLVYSLVKEYDESLLFSISPSADIEKCKNTFYGDVEKWCNEEGFVDFVVPQIYYGFVNEEMPFEEVLREWCVLSENSDTKLVLGMASYKCGREDEFAGNGKNEWKENVNILSRQYEQALKSQACQGFSLFSYSYCFGENVNEISKKEIKKLLYMVE